MALIKCKECAHAISDKATTCPSCGVKIAPRKKTSLLTWIVVGIFGLGFGNALLFGGGGAKTDTQPTPTAATTPKPPTQKDLQLQLAGAGALTLKRASKDPDTFELKSADVMPDGTACYTYRAKNGFGALLAGNAILTSKGKLLIQEANGNAFVTAWNKSCTKDGGDDIAPYLKTMNLL